MDQGSRKQELELLALELSDVTEALREISRRVRRIERRVDTVLPRASRRTEPNRRVKLDDGVARQTITRMKEDAVNGLRIEDELRRMTVKNELAVLARELGLTNTKLPPKDDLVRLIATRIRQSAIVARGFRDAFRDHEARPR